MPPAEFPSPCDDDVEVPKLNNFITQIIDEELAAGKITHTVTRFPPEPNGWLHLGHAKSICLNFGIAKQYGGKCHLRFDDTNPAAEEEEYIEGIQEDVRWLGFNWHENLFYASDYFEQLYSWAEDLIEKGLAYVDEQTETEVRVNRGSVTEPGKDSVYRARTVEENLTAFRRMRAGGYEDGQAILRAKIDMSHPNMSMRDPPMYRIKRATHPRTGDKWCIYPIYDYAHGQSDSIEHISHSICTLEFYDHRILYEWFQEKLGIFRTQQLEFARFNLSHTVMSKRRLLKLVQERFVRGWDDPRMPTLAGCRRRGYPPCAIRKFAYSVGVAKRENVIPMFKLEAIVRETLHPRPRRLAVLDPLKVVLTNWSESGQETELVTLRNHPEEESMGTRQVKMGKVIYIDRTDFAEVPPPKWHRLSPGHEVRLRSSYWIKCNEIIKRDGEISELHCEIDPQTKGGVPPTEKRSVKGVIHWVSDVDSVNAEFRIYDRLFTQADPDEGGDWVANLNPNSLVTKVGRLEACAANESSGTTFQFERVGFFAVDYDSTPEKPVFNLTVSLQDTFAGETNEQSKEAQAKLQAKLAREKAAEERRLKKLAKEERKKKKEEDEGSGPVTVPPKQVDV